MKRVLAIIIAVLVSIIWLSMVVGIPVIATTDWLDPYLPAPVREVGDLANLDLIGPYTDLLGNLPLQFPEVAQLPEVVEPDVGEPDAGEPDTGEPDTGEPDTGEPDVILVPETPVTETTDISTPLPETPASLPEEPTPTEAPAPADTPAPPPAEVETPADTPGGSLRDSIVATLTAAAPREQETPSAATVSSQDVTVLAQASVRAGPGLDFDTVGTVDANATVTVIGEDPSGQWFLLEDRSWIAGTVLAEQPAVPVIEDAGDGPTGVATPAPGPAETQAVTATVNADANVRTGPGTTSDVAGGVRFGAQVVVVGIYEEGGWYLLEDGTWIASTLLGEAVEGVPIVDEEGLMLFGPDAGQPAAPGGAQGATPAAPSAGGPATVNTAANLRSGPGTTFDAVGSLAQGEEITVVGRNAAGDWFQLEGGEWIFADLVDNPPGNLPVVNNP